MKTKKEKKQIQRKEIKRKFKCKKKKKHGRLLSNQVILMAMDLPHTEENSGIQEDKPREKKKKNKISEKKSMEQSMKQSVKKPVLRSSNIREEPLYRGLSHMGNLEGLIVLGRIREVLELYLIVDLPGGIHGIVPAANICMEYVSNLTSFIVGQNEELPSLNYKIGQLVLTRIESVKGYETYRPTPPAFYLPVKRRLDEKKVKLSMRPEDVNLKLSSEDFKVGLIVSALVRSIEEHVYVMDCGVKKVRAYLSKDQSLKYETFYNDGRQLAIGHVILCVVTSSSVGSTSTDPIIVSLSLDPEHMAKAYPADKKALLVPGMIYNVEISLITKAGAFVQFSSGEEAFVFHEYIDNFEEIKIGQQFLARILYIKSPEQAVYMTMLKNLCYPGPKLNFIIPGFSGKAKIVDVLKQTFTLKVSNWFCGLATIKQRSLRQWMSETDFQKMIEKQKNLEKSEGGKKSYFQKLQEETEFLKNCVDRLVVYRTRYYDFMSEKFICEISPRQIYINHLKYTGLQLGMSRICKIQSRNNGYITVLVEKNGSFCIRGFVHWIHYDDEVSKENIHLVESRFTVGSLKECKVISGSPIVEFSFKPSLLKSERSILYNSDKGKSNIPYDGIVEEITSDFLKVKFYNNFVCGVPRNKVQDGLKYPLEESYKVGQLVTCYIHRVNTHSGHYDMEVRKVENQVQIIQENYLKH